MKNIEEFVEALVRIELIEQSECMGHYPFQKIVENSDGGLEISSLALGGDVAACNRIFNRDISNGAKRVYMSLDFPSFLDIKDDFVAIFSYENGETSVFAIPYNQDGEVLERVYGGDALAGILKQINNFK